MGCPDALLDRGRRIFAALDVALLGNGRGSDDGLAQEPRREQCAADRNDQQHDPGRDFERGRLEGATDIGGPGHRGAEDRQD